MVEKLNNHRDNLGKQLYMFCFSLYLIINFLGGTTFSRSFGLGMLNFYLRASQVIALLVFCKIIFFDRHKFNTNLAFLVGVSYLFIVCKQAHDVSPLVMYLFVIGAYGIYFKEILQRYIQVILVMLVFVYGATLIGLIPNSIMLREGSDIVRTGLGLATSSDLASHVFYVMLAFALLKNFKIKSQEIVFLSLIAILIFALTNSRLDAILMGILLLCLYFRSYIFSGVKNLKLSGTSCLIVVYAIANIFLTYFFDPNVKWYMHLDNLLSRRLLFGKMAFENYQIRFFGQYIYQNGNGDPRGFTNYYFIDSAYIQALMMFGAIFLLFMLGLLFYVSYRAFQVQYFGLVVGILLIVLSMAINHHFWQLSYNVILLALFSKLPNYAKTRSD